MICREEVTFPGFVDCMYLNAPSELVLSNGLGNVITIKSTGYVVPLMWRETGGILQRRNTKVFRWTHCVIFLQQVEGCRFVESLPNDGGFVQEFCVC